MVHVDLCSHIKFLPARRLRCLAGPKITLDHVRVYVCIIMYVRTTILKSRVDGRGWLRETEFLSAHCTGST